MESNIESDETVSINVPLTTVLMLIIVSDLKVSELSNVKAVSDPPCA